MWGRVSLRTQLPEAHWFGQAEFIFSCPEDLPVDLRIGMRVTGNPHDIGVDLMGKREAAIDLEHPRRCPEQRGIFALLKVKIGDQRNPSQVNFLG
jgi:hypothetical protein